MNNLMGKELRDEVKRLTKDLGWGVSMEIENLVSRAFQEGRLFEYKMSYQSDTEMEEE